MALHPPRWASCLLLILGIAAAGSSARGATRWVAPNGSNTSGNGSSQSPWATISHALDRAADGDLVLVRPGTYSGRVDLRGDFLLGVVVRSEVPYRAVLRHSATVVLCYYGRGITLEGFEITHTDSAGPLLIQIQDLRGAPGGTDRTGRIVLRDNVIHDSLDNDLLKINNGADDVLVTGNLFYNQTGHDEHIDINGASNVVVQDNVFLNDFEGSGRVNTSSTGSFIVAKDSNGESDGELGSRDVTIRRNVFLHWQGSPGSNFLLLGEDGNPYHEAHAVLVENNLFLGDALNPIRAPFGVKGCRDILVRSNSTSGNLPGEAFSMRLNVEGSNPPNENVDFQANLWADPTGTMVDFSDTPPAESVGIELDRNLYWNAGLPIPSSGSDLVNYTADANRRVGDPRLASPAAAVLPRWQPALGRFADGSSSIRAAFERLVELYAHPASGSAAIDAATAATSASEDILGRPRDASPDLGCYEANATTDVSSAPGGWALEVHRPFPNPAPGRVTLGFRLHRPGRVEVDVLDVAGRRIRSLPAPVRGSGEGRLEWDGRDDHGRRLAAGVYILRVRALGMERRVRCVLVG